MVGQAGQPAPALGGRRTRMLTQDPWTSPHGFLAQQAGTPGVKLGQGDKGLARLPSCSHYGEGTPCASSDTTGSFNTDTLDFIPEITNVSQLTQPSSVCCT